MLQLIMPDIIFWRLFWSHAGTGILCILSYYHDLQPKFLTQSSLNLVKDLIYTIRYVHCQGLTSIAIALMAFPALNFWVLRWCIHEPKDIQTYLADRSTVIYCHSWEFYSTLTLNVIYHYLFNSFCCVPCP